MCQNISIFNEISWFTLILFDLSLHMKILKTLKDLSFAVSNRVCGSFLTRQRKNRAPKKHRRPSEPTCLHTQNPPVTLSSLSHIQILYINCHIHKRDYEWSAALLTVASCEASRLSELHCSCSREFVQQSPPSMCGHQLECMIEEKTRSNYVPSYFHNKMSRCL